VGDPASRDESRRDVLVVGAGLAGAQVVAELRAAGFDGRIRVLGAEGVPPYDRPPLSKHLFDRPTPAWLVGELGIDLAVLADEVHLGLPARGLVLGGDRPAVRTDTGVVAADDVILATGAHAVRPPGWEAALTLHTTADADRLRDALPPRSRLVVVGAGWIGAEVATVAATAGHTVTVVEAAGTPLSAALGEQVGALTVPWYDEAGVELLTGVLVAAVEPDAVTLADGRTLRADVVLAAVGARPSTAWLAGSLPLDPDGSVRIAPTYQVLTPAPITAAEEREVSVADHDADVTFLGDEVGDGAGVGVRAGGGGVEARRPARGLWAVGDVARRWSPRHGLVPGGHWDGALRGPRVLVGHLLGRPLQPPDDDPAPYVFSTQLGHDLAMFGVPRGGDVVLRGDPASGDGWAALWYSGERVVAIFVVDRPRDVGAARRLFTGPLPPRLDRAAAADPSLPLRALP